MIHKTYYDENMKKYIYKALNHNNEICTFMKYNTEVDLIKNMNRFCYYKGRDSFEGIYKGTYVEDES